MLDRIRWLNLSYLVEPIAMPVDTDMLAQGPLLYLWTFCFHQTLIQIFIYALSVKLEILLRIKFL